MRKIQMRIMIRFTVLTTLAMGCITSLSLAQSAPMRSSQPVLSATSVPMIVIPEQGHWAHASVFEAKMNKDANIRSEIAKYGRDVAFTRWMQRDHPYVYAHMCVPEEAHIVAAHCKHTDAMSEFSSLQGKRSDLRSAVASKGYDVAFAAWLYQAHPDEYKEHMAGSSSGGMSH